MVGGRKPDRRNGRCPSAGRELRGGEVWGTKENGETNFKAVKSITGVRPWQVDGCKRIWRREHLASDAETSSGARRTMGQRGRTASGNWVYEKDFCSATFRDTRVKSIPSWSRYGAAPAGKVEKENRWVSRIGRMEESGRGEEGKGTKWKEQVGPMWCVSDNSWSSSRGYSEGRKRESEVQGREGGAEESQLREIVEGNSRSLSPRLKY